MSPCDNPLWLRYDLMTSPMFTRGFSLGTMALQGRGGSLVTNSRKSKREFAGDDSNSLTLWHHLWKTQPAKFPEFLGSPAHLTLRRRNHRRLLQPEFQQCFARHFHLFALGEYLHSRACCRSCSRTNRSPFSAAGDRSNDGSNDGPAAHFLSRVRAASLPLQTVVAADQRIIVPVNHNAHELQLQFRASSPLARFLHVCKPAINVRALPRQKRVIDIEVSLKTGVENVANPVFRGIHAINHPNQKSLSRRNCHFAVLSS